MAHGWPAVFARLNFTKCERKQFPYGKVGCLVSFLRQIASSHVGWRRNKNYQLLSTPGRSLPPSPIYGVRETWAVGSHQNSYFKGKGIFQWSSRWGKQREGFEGNFHGRIGERQGGKEEKDKDPCVRTPYLWGTLLRLLNLLPTNHHPSMCHYIVKGVNYTKLQLPAWLLHAIYLT